MLINRVLKLGQLTIGGATLISNLIDGLIILPSQQYRKRGDPVCSFHPRRRGNKYVKRTLIGINK